MKSVSLDSINELDVSHNAMIKKRVMLARDKVNHLNQFSCAIFPVGECAPAHTHDDMAEVFFILSGSGEIIINNRTTHIKQNDCILVEPGETHELKNTGNIDMTVIYFGIID